MADTKDKVKATEAKKKESAFEDPKLAAYKAFLESRKNKKALENSLLVSLAVFFIALFVVFPEIRAVIEEMNQDVQIEIPKVIPIQEKTEEKKVEQRRTRQEQRQRDLGALPSLDRPDEDVIIIADQRVDQLDVEDEYVGDYDDFYIPDEAPGPIEVAGDIVRPTYSRAGQVPYPQRARILRRTGSVKVRVVITKEGTLEDIEILEENPPDFGFGETALQWLKGCSWSPALQNGKPIYARYTFIFRFTLK